MLSSCRCRSRSWGGWGGLAVVSDEVPGSVKDTIGFGSEEIEQTAGQIETSVWTSRTLVGDCGSCGLPIVGHDDLLEAVRARVSVTILLKERSNSAVANVLKCRGTAYGSIQSNNEVARDVVYTAGAPMIIIVRRIKR